MHLALIASGIGAGDEVISTPTTFAATINVAIHTGATPVLADIDINDFCIDPAAIERAITPRTSDHACHHGGSVPYDAITELAPLQPARRRGRGARTARTSA
jgi:dTDP-4-amino-4,6-dideoxygalactose transaminase